MSGFLINCTVNTARSTYSAASGTSAPTPYKRGIKGHIEAFAATQYNYKTLPEAALESNFVLKVWPDAQGVLPDVKYGDMLTAIYRKDGKTPWPGVNPNEAFHVVHTMPSTLGFLYHLQVFIARETGGGAVY